MNLILFPHRENALRLPLADPRAVHITDVLRRTISEEFDVGVINGPRGKATLVAKDAEALSLAFSWAEEAPPLLPMHLLVGLCRPQTVRKILFDAASLGIASLHFFKTEKGEASYAQSSLWSSGEWERHLIAGVEQAFCTRIPVVTWKRSLAELCIEAQGGSRVALDNYEASGPLGETPLGLPLHLAFGSERGWSREERALLRMNGFLLAHLGKRVLRTETAVTAAHAICSARLGLHR